MQLTELIKIFTILEYLGTSVCGGDSGGGMVFKQRTKYYLRGIVSISVALQNSLKCDAEHYIVFADAAKHTSWISQNI